MLVIYTDKLLLLPGMLILLPGFLEMRGNISGTFASRLSSGLFLGVINPNKIDSHLIRGNLYASFSLAIIVSLVLGLIALAFNYLLLGIVTWQILWLPLIAGIIANGIEIFITLVATIYL